MHDGRRVTNTVTLERPGDFCWAWSMEGAIAAICFLCPTCGANHAVGVKPGDPSGWEWNGDLDKPTLSPSLSFAYGHPKSNPDCRWHGFLKDGEWHDA